jgi:hypothetical protein
MPFVRHVLLALIDFRNITDGAPMGGSVLDAFDQIFEVSEIMVGVLHAEHPE